MTPTTRALILRPCSGVLPVADGAIQYRPARFADVEKFRAGPWLLIRLMHAALRGGELKVAHTETGWPLWRDVEEAAKALERMGLIELRWAAR